MCIIVINVDVALGSEKTLNCVLKMGRYDLYPNPNEWLLQQSYFWIVSDYFFFLPAH